MQEINEIQKIVFFPVPLEEFKTEMIDCFSTFLKNQADLQSHPKEDLIVPIQGAAEHLNLAIPTIYALVGKRELPFFKKGKRLYFSKQELSAWINSGRKKTVSEIEADAIQTSKASRIRK